MTLNLNRVLLVLAVICLAVAFLMTAGWLFDAHNPSAWGYIGLTFGFASFLL